MAWFVYNAASVIGTTVKNKQENSPVCKVGQTIILRITDLYSFPFYFLGVPQKSASQLLT